MLPEKNRIRKGFHSILKQGKRSKSSYFIVIYKKNSFNCPRFGVVITNKVGNAVVRNLIKRRIKAIIKENIDSFEPGVDYVIIPSKYVPDWNNMPFDLFKEDLLHNFNNISIV